MMEFLEQPSPIFDSFLNLFRTTPRSEMYTKVIKPTIRYFHSEFELQVHNNKRHLSLDMYLAVVFMMRHGYRFESPFESDLPSEQHFVVAHKSILSNKLNFFANLVKDLSLDHLDIIRTVFELAENAISTARNEWVASEVEIHIARHETLNIVRDTLEQDENVYQTMMGVMHHVETLLDDGLGLAYENAFKIIFLLPE